MSDHTCAAVIIREHGWLCISMDNRAQVVQACMIWHEGPAKIMQGLDQTCIVCTILADPPRMVDDRPFRENQDGASDSPCICS